MEKWAPRAGLGAQAEWWPLPALRGVQSASCHLSWAQSNGCLQVWHLMAWLGSVESALEKAPLRYLGLRTCHHLQRWHLLSRCQAQGEFPVSGCGPGIWGSPRAFLTHPVQRPSCIHRSDLASAVSHTQCQLYHLTDSPCSFGRGSSSAPLLEENRGPRG